MRFPWRKWNRIIHRDLGYFLFGMTLIYAISGIALNHIKEWNSNYDITRREYSLDPELIPDNITKSDAEKWLTQWQRDSHVKKIYQIPGENQVKFFIDGGSVVINRKTGQVILEIIKRRPILYHLNFLHYNPRKLWTWFSDFFALGLAILAISGLFILKGKKGITGRGAWLTAAGILTPLLFLFLYL